MKAHIASVEIIDDDLESVAIVYRNEGGTPVVHLMEDVDADALHFIADVLETFEGDDLEFAEIEKNEEAKK